MFSCVNHTKHEKVQRILNLEHSEIDSMVFVCKTTYCGELYNNDLILQDSVWIKKITAAINKAKYVDRSSKRSYSKFVYDATIYLKDKESYDIRILSTQKQGAYAIIHGDGAIFTGYLGHYRNDSLEFIMDEIYNNYTPSDLGL